MAAQEWFANGIKLLQVQQRNAEFAQKWFSGGVGALRDQTEYTRRTAEVFTRSARKQQEGFRTVGRSLQGLPLPLRLRPGGSEKRPGRYPAGTTASRGDHRTDRGDPQQDRGSHSRG